MISEIPYDIIRRFCNISYENNLGNQILLCQLWENLIFQLRKLILIWWV